MTETPSARWLPGDLDPEEEVRRIIRVDHAGEYGATRIYAGQLAILGKAKSAETIRHMASQESVHKAEFDRLLVERRIAPTILAPLWDVAGFALGAATALMGERAAMACTVAVEETIDEHYRSQVEALGEREPELRATIERFRADENEHRATAQDYGAEQMPGYTALAGVIRLGSKLAIFLSSRI